MFQKPVKRIVTKKDLEDFLNSDAYRTFIGYIIRLNDSVRDLKIDSDVDISPVRIYHFWFAISSAICWQIEYKVQSNS